MAALLTATCGSERPLPTSPAVVPLDLKPGLQIVQLTGFTFSADPRYPPCQPPGRPPTGTSVWTTVNLVQEGNEWIGRSPEGLGSIEIRLHATGEMTALRKQVVVGTVRGTGFDSELKRDIHVTFQDGVGSGPAVFEGEKLSSTSYFVGGRVSGVVRFSDSAGATGECEAVQFAIQPY